MGVSPITVRSWVIKGWLKANVTPGGHRRFYLEDVNKLLQEHGAALQESKEASRILVVDDDAVFRTYLVDLLMTLFPHIEVAEAADGFAAGVSVVEFRPDIIFLDYQMPGLSGVSVCQQIKANPQHAAIRIIAVTGTRQSSIGAELLQAGAESVLLKPVKTEQLLHALSLETTA